MVFDPRPSLISDRAQHSKAGAVVVALDEGFPVLRAQGPLEGASLLSRPAERGTSMGDVLHMFLTFDSNRVI